MKESPLIHPILFAVFPVLFLFSQNIAEVQPVDTVRPFLLVILLSLLLFVIFRLIARSWQKGGIMASLFLISFFSFGHLSGALKDIKIDIRIVELDGEGITITLFCLLLLVGSYLITRTSKQLKRLTTVLNTIAAILVVIQIAQAGYALATRPTVNRLGERAVESLQMPDNPPDIYYLILDAYGRHDILQGIYHYNNSEFLDYLYGKGFYIAEKSHSNYCQTLLSLAATLNLNYISNLGSFNPNSWFRTPLRQLIRKNYVVAMLKKHGYKLAAFSSGFEGTDLKDANLYFSPSFVPSEFENVVLNTTPVPFILKRFSSQYELHRQRVNLVFDQVGSIDRSASPMFVFAHVVSPHPPFVFDSQGQPIDPDRPFGFADGNHFMDAGGTVDEYISGYWHQIAYVTMKLRETIDQILSRYKDNPPIIIIQGDHGPGSRLYWQNVKKTDVRERFSILNACYLPGIEGEPMYPEITSVNTFRVILNEYFGTHYELLPDRSFYSASSRPYLFFEVTQTLNILD